MLIVRKNILDDFWNLEVILTLQLGGNRVANDDHGGARTGGVNPGPCIHLHPLLMHVLAHIILHH